MPNKLIYVLIAVVALAAGMAAQRWLAVNTPEPLPEPLLVDLAGRSHTLAEWRGRVVVLNFWATWCPPCRDEMPGFVQLQQEFEVKGLQFVGVAIDDPGTVRKFLQQHPVNYPVLVGDERAPAWADSLGNTMSFLPFSVVFDRDGHQVHAQIGLFRREQLLKVIAPVLKTKTDSKP